MNTPKNRKRYVSERKGNFNVLMGSSVTGLRRILVDLGRGRMGTDFVVASSDRAGGMEGRDVKFLHRAGTFLAVIYFEPGGRRKIPPCGLFIIVPRSFPLSPLEPSGEW
jgi:hypothetical protein